MQIGDRMFQSVDTLECRFYFVSIFSMRYIASIDIQCVTKSVFDMNKKYFTTDLFFYHFELQNTLLYARINKFRMSPNVKTF